MRLTTYKYSEFQPMPNAWQLEPLALQDVNLIVGKNSSGKSRALSTIMVLSRLISGRQKLTWCSGHWDCIFEDDGDEYHYEVMIAEFKVIKEILTKNDQVLLDRRADDGSGKIFATKTNELIDFQTPPTDLAAVMRRDKTQHQFFEKLHEWGMSVFSYTFGTPMGKNQLAIVVNSPVEIDLYNQEMVIGIFRQGEKELGFDYVNAIKTDMRKIGYPIDEILVSQPSAVTSAPVSVVGIAVKESDLGCITEQLSMSQGMFRALSIIIQVNYAQMSFKAGCVIVDDIGEGLDFERSCELIELLVNKSSTSNVQLILSTNDRFVMNNVPLTSWTVLKRMANTVSVFNYSNSKKYFDDFKLTGLNNFDFFAMDFVSEDLDKLQEQGTANEKTGGVC